MRSATEAVAIEAMHRRHVRSVMAIDAEVYPDTWSYDLYLSELSQPETRHYVVAKVDTKIVGGAGLIMGDAGAHVTTMVVDPGWHGQRIGTRLMLDLAREARRRGAETLSLEVRAGNKVALALYRRFGLAPAGVRKGYYTRVREDAIVMWAHDIDQPAYGRRLDEIEASL